MAVREVISNLHIFAMSTSYLIKNMVFYLIILRIITDKKILNNLVTEYKVVYVCLRARPPLSCSYR